MKIFSKIAAMFTILALFSIAFAVDPPAPTTMTVDISILETAQIIVVPASLAWSNIQVGTKGGLKNLTIKNTGSVNVSNLYVYADTLTDELPRPYGSSNASYYAAGGVITLKNETSAEQYYFGGRVEWNWTEDVANKDLTMASTGLDRQAGWGFYVNISSDYFWAIANGSDAMCNNSGAKFAVEDDVDLGTTATRTPSVTDITRNAGDQYYSYFSDNRATSPLKDYCIAVNTTCEKIYIYKYDKRTEPNFGGCTNSRYLNPGPIPPAQTERLSLDVFVPRGLPAGEMTQATLTFVASL